MPVPGASISPEPANWRLPTGQHPGSGRGRTRVPLDLDAGALAGGAHDVERGADGLRALAHDADPEVPGGDDGGVEPAAIVADLQPQATVRAGAQVEVDVVRLGMPRDVVERLLDDPIERRLD